MIPPAPTLAPAPPAAPCPDSVKRLLPWLVAVAFFMESLDTTILNTAVPAIAKALAVAPLSMKAVLSSYTLSLAVFIPISGWMADRFGTRRVFSSAIGLFTLGSFLCGISSNIHVLVACRILQGCGGAMMVPVGRLTMVRTFAKSELIRAMSFVAIPGLIGPMLGPHRRRPHRRLLPLAGDLFRQHADWPARSCIWSIGIFPDYREEHTHPLDIIGLILFGSGIALLSYVLEVFGEHTLRLAHAVRVAGALRRSSHRLRTAGDAHQVSLAPADLVSHPDFSRVGQRQLFHPPGHRRNPVPLSAALPGGPRIYADSIRPSHDAPGGGRHEPQADDAGHSQALRSTATY